jgi:ATP-binding cassette subfamily B protein
VVLDAGRIVERGTHAQLIAKDGLYATLWKHQAEEPDAVVAAE